MTLVIKTANDKEKHHYNRFSDCRNRRAVLFVFSAPGGNSEPERFVVPLNATRSQTIKSLSDQRFIKTSLGVNIALLTRGKFGTIAPGGYKISKNQNAFQTAGILTKEPYMKWAVIPEGERKEQIANQLSKILGWNNETKNEFLNGYMKIGQDYKEGVYFPDTYLLPKDETGRKSRSASLPISKTSSARFIPNSRKIMSGGRRP